MERWLITGAGGFIGRDLVRRFARAAEIVATCRTDGAGAGSQSLDVTDMARVRAVFAAHEPTVVVHLAAMKDVHACERQVEETVRVNVLGTRNIVEMCAAYGAFLVYVSSDYVFKGDRGGYRDGDAREATTVYGASKKLSEDLILERDVDAAICRTGGVYGAPGPRRNLVAWVLDTLRKGEQIAAYADVFNTPTLLDDLGEAIRLVIRERLRGAVQVAGADRVNRHEFLSGMAAALGFGEHLVAASECDDPVIPRDLSMVSSPRVLELGLSPCGVSAGLQRLRRALEANGDRR
ncbi:MAG: SDR family oxidoreductase [Candidatus Rokubacteria bacterium]|nr:SDR family oxidoreductase [Candidatus Rokubacteria bacterium]